MGRNTKYSDDFLSLVKKDVTDNIMTMSQISNKHNMPLKTISNYFSGLRNGLGMCKNSKAIDNLGNWNRLNQTIKKEKELKIKFDKKGFIKVYKSNYWINLKNIGIGWEFCFIYK